MRRLILMRHAKSDWDHAALSDHARPLNKRGRNSAKALGDWLRRAGFLPDQVLCSSAQRTGETLHLLDLPPETRTEFLPALYHAEAAAMLQVLNGADARCVLMVGHNPGICEMGHRLLETPPSHLRFEDYPTGATLVADFETDDWATVDWYQGKAVDFVIPREL